VIAAPTNFATAIPAFALNAAKIAFFPPPADMVQPRSFRPRRSPVDVRFVRSIY
jgi:hypothetical protein